MTFVMERFSAACLVAGCGKHEPSYKDRIGTIDPATAPVIMPEAPKKQR